MIAKIFINGNAMLDFFGERAEYYRPSAKLVTLADKRKIEIFVSPISFGTVNYFLVKFENTEIAIEKLREFKVLCKTAPIDDLIIEKGLNSKFQDFEDAPVFLCY